MTSREARRAAEATEEAAREAARLTQAQVDALATQIVATSGQARPKVRIDAAQANLFTTSAAGTYGRRGAGATGTLADGRTYRVECLNPWSGYHLYPGGR